MEYNLIISGIFSGHIFYFFTTIWPTFVNGKNYLKTPSFFEKFDSTSGSNSIDFRKNKQKVFSKKK
jgi:hypothetical protein